MFIPEAKINLNVSRQTGQILTRLLQLRPGSFHRIRYKRPLKFKKTFEGSNFGFKETEGIYRLGINYDSVGSVKDKRLSGELPKTNQGLPANLRWIVAPKLLQNVQTEKAYARIYTVKGQNPKISYTLNGMPVEPEQLGELCLASGFVHKETPCFMLDVENFIEIQ